jgi:hypothetical protein
MDEDEIIIALDCINHLYNGIYIDIIKLDKNTIELSIFPECNKEKAQKIAAYFACALIFISNSRKSNEPYKTIIK